MSMTTYTSKGTIEESKWEKLIKELGNILFFWFFGVVFFFIYRFVFIIIFRNELGSQVGLSEYLSVLDMGLKFDCSVIAYFLMLPLVAALSLSYFDKFGIIKKVRKSFQYLFIVLSAIICVVTLNYYQEYKDQFNSFLFLGLTDDKEAVFKTIISYYNPILNILTLIFVILTGVLIFRFFENKTFIYNILKRGNRKYFRVIILLLTIFLFISCIRGTFWTHNANRRIAWVTSDDFLNKTVINPFRSLKYAYDDYKEYTSTDKGNPFGEEDNMVATYGSDNVSDIIKKEAHGALLLEKPKQIFLIIMESYDSWPLLEKYEPMGISTNLRRIAEKGTHFYNFLPSAYATQSAYATLATGTPFTGVNINRYSTIGESYISSIFSQFKKLGYKTNAFYGGPSSWQNLGAFSKFHGADNVYSGVEVGGRSEAGDWGIEDERLFDLILDRVNPEEYTFNLILTISYHAPFSVDVYSRGFPYKSVKDMPKEAQELYKEGMTLNEMGHLWYGDWAIGQFMEKAERKYKSGLYAFTGDHYGRRFLTPTPNLYERSSVPFILYGEGVEAQKLSTPGGHIDVLPTLIEMVAPEGFTYYSFGESMFSADKAFGIGFNKVINETTLYSKEADYRIDSINLSSSKDGKSEIMAYHEEYNKLMRLAWHYIVRGDSFIAD